MAPEFPEARVRRSGLEWADQKTVMEAWSAADEDARQRFVDAVASVSDADLVGLCEDLVAHVRAGQDDSGDDWDNQDAPAPEGGHPPVTPEPDGDPELDPEPDPPHDPPSNHGDENVPNPEPDIKPEPEPENKPAGRRRSSRR